MNRDSRIDSLKGFLIVLMVIGHIPFSWYGIERCAVLSYFHKWIYFFHMPLFLSMSVLYLKDTYSWLLKRTSLILIPYVVWFLHGHKMMLINDPVNCLRKLLVGNWDSVESIIWFLPALFILNVLFFLFKKANRKLQGCILLLSICSFIWSGSVMQYHDKIPFGIDVAIYVFFLVFLIKLVYARQVMLVENIGFILVVLMVLFSSIVLFLYEPVKTNGQWSAIIDLAQFFVASSFIGYISFLMLNIGILVLFLKLESNRVLQYIGKNSFPVFLLHLEILYRLPKYVSFESIGLKFLFLGAAFVGSVLLPILISKILMRTSEKFKYIGMV